MMIMMIVIMSRDFYVPRTSSATRPVSCQMGTETPRVKAAEA